MADCPLITMPDSAGPSGNFLHKPVRGWLHPDQQILKKSVTYAVRVSRTSKVVF